jgi:vacuolar-type H+-ATPase subunit H
VIAIDILHLVDRLETLIEQGRRLPFTSRVFVDEGLCLDIIDQMRISIPEEIRQAKRLEQERERIVAEAQEEGGKIIAKAREDAARLVAEHELRRQAQQRAERMLAEAERQALAIRQGADDYAADVLTHLAEELLAVQRTTANGLAALEQRRERHQGAGTARQVHKPSAEASPASADAL